MSGLAAQFERDGRPADRASVWAMLAAVPYRGPDGMSIGTWDEVALGHAKMAMTGEDARERQPLVSPRTGCVLIADVRLDNRDELRACLPEFTPVGASDAALILLAYDTWGTAVLARLLGDFAIVMWDPRSRSVLCARDTSGQRSLFYRFDSHTFAAASEIHQLLQDPQVRVAPNEERIREMLLPINMFQNEQDQAATFFDGVHAVPAGQYLVVTRTNLELTRYWELGVPHELRYRHDDEYVEHFRTLFFDVVRTRLRTSHPLGVLVSGGLDSSSVTGVAQQLYERGEAETAGFTAFHFGFNGFDCDETELVRDLQSMYAMDVRFLSVDDLGGRLQLEPRGFLETPNMGLPAGRDLVLGAANELGIRALLTGDIADGCVFGSPLVFDSLLRKGRLPALLRRLGAYHHTSGEMWRTLVGRYCVLPLLPMSVQHGVMTRYTRRVFSRHWAQLLPTWIPEPLRADLSERYLERSLARERQRRFASPARAAEYALLYPPEVARHPVPWPIEIWRPFADRRLHEFLLAIPPEQKYEPHPSSEMLYAGSKQLVRRAMDGVLPDRIRLRTAKTIFSSALTSEFDGQWPMLEAAFGPSAAPQVAARGFVDQARFWSRLHAMRRGTEANDLLYVMDVIGLESWLRTLALPRPTLVTVPPPTQGAASAAGRGGMAMAVG